jgi:hypothetical protein
VADVVHLDVVAADGLIALAHLEVLDDEVGRRDLTGRYEHVGLLV